MKPACMVIYALIVMGRNGKTGMLVQDVQGMLFHVEALRKGEVHPHHLLGADAELVGLSEEAVTMFVCRDVVVTVAAVGIDSHVVRDAVMIVS